MLVTNQAFSLVPGAMWYIIIISHVHRAYDYMGSFGVLWVHKLQHLA